MDKIEKPALIVMAAGMGSRYGGLKQIDPVGDHGEIILDFSLYDAMLAGFEEVVFVIKKETEADFRALIDKKAGIRLNVHYVFQDVNDIPDCYLVPAGREKPWGTGHAVMAARHIVGGPFAVINSDDYYGAAAFQHMYDFLEGLYLESDSSDGDIQQYAMVAFKLANTLSETGHVARGICEVEDGKLINITERTMIRRLTDKDSGSDASEGEIAFSLDDGKTWTALSEDTPVSMNFWGFGNSFMKELVDGFPEFLDKIPGVKPGKNHESTQDPLKAEYFLPAAVDRLLKEGRAEVKVLNSSDKWYGVTYKEDKESVVDALRSMKDKGLYPPALFD